MPLWSKISGRLTRIGLFPPRTRLARFTLYLAAAFFLLELVETAFRLTGFTAGAEPLQGWTSFLGFILAIVLLAVALRWFRSHVMWSVRNRLIVTYLFIGGVPVILAFTFALGTIYMIVEHVATYLTVAEIQAQEQRLAAANAAAAEEILKRGRTPAEIMASDTVFPGRTVTVSSADAAPRWIKGDFSGLVSDSGALYLRACKQIKTPARSQVIESSVPVNEGFLAGVAAHLGTLTLQGGNVRIQRDGDAISAEPQQKSPTPGSISAGTIPPPAGKFDPELEFRGLVQTTDWQSGDANAVFLAGSTRGSTLIGVFGAAMGMWTGVLGVVLLVIAGIFAAVVLVALIIGARLTRTITYSVANLYKATQHINRGDFDHRIQVREKDQLAALQMSFNSMTDSIQRLILEQKEKERLQSELEIAHEVQAQLFPHEFSSTRTLELHGICQPARIVSGDYYDFLSYGPDQVGLAVGDISGKGISAALLMATIHSAVRAYEQEQLVAAGAASAYETTGRSLTMAAPLQPPSPAQMLWLLNRHLYRSTPPEKYATLFLGFYDGDKRRLTYSNGGHLAPIILGADGSVRRLEAGGMVVGLFDNMEYSEESVEFRSGDIFIAFSDGMTEPENEFGEFGEDRLLETVVANRSLPLDRISAHAVAAVQDWIGSTEQPDDITLVLARRLA
ncbi:MAG TPA: SpoIIE family protein phosphatase [Candidatus Angelobacter sp.]|nr:SpoIIE family protein phosphatase [Candidatus Angelobacter sp.]